MVASIFSSQQPAFRGGGGPVINLSGTTVSETATIGTLVGVLSVSGGSGVYAFTKIADPDLKFAVSGSNLDTAALLDYEAGQSHSVTVQADNGVDVPFSRLFTITVTNVPEQPALSALTLPASINVGTTVNITGATAGSTITGTVPAGWTINSGARTIGVSGGAATGLQNWSLVETLLDSPNSPRTSPGTSTVVSAPPAWTPLSLGAKLVFWFDAETTSSMTLTGSLVDQWRDRKSDFPVAQATSGFKPVLNPTGINGRPAVVFDGSDDYLQAIAGSTSASAIPQGANTSEVWQLANDTAVGSAVLRMMLSTGSTSSQRRATGRNSALPNPVSLRVPQGAGTTPVNGTTSLNGVHAVRTIFASAGSRVFVDQLTTAEATTAVALNSTDTLLTVGSLTSSSSFWQGPVNSVIVTTSLTADEADEMMNFLKTRGGLP